MVRLVAEKDEEKQYEDKETESLFHWTKRAAAVSSNIISPLTIHEVKKDEYGTNVAVVYGGINGRGNWRNYFNIISTFLDTLNTYYGIDGWLIKLENDCLDDCWTAEIGLRFKKHCIDTAESPEKNEDDEMIFDIGKLASDGLSDYLSKTLIPY